MLARVRVLGALVTFVCVLMAAQSAFAYQEAVNGPNPFAQCSCHQAGVPNPGDPVARLACQHCHGYTSANFPLGQYNSDDVLNGPHGNYTAVSNRCESCHTLHDAPAAQLLPADTVVGTCFTCHDGTAGFGVYGAIKSRTGLDPATDLTLGSHRIATTSSIPGGDAATGGGASRTFEGPGGLLICVDCHSPHASTVVQPFMGERKRTRSYERQDRPTDKLLKQKPTGASAAVADYGSDWCAGCHAGRLSGMAGVFNHPVDSLALRADPFVFRSVAGGRNLATGSTTDAQGSRHSKSGMYLFGIGNGDFLMNDPRVAPQVGHSPICQQCHEDTRDVGDLNADGSVPFNTGYTLKGADGSDATDNPRFQNFPHETQNNNFVIEAGDDLCLNCHLPSRLP